MKKAGIIHLGCSKNQVDTEILLGFLRDLGYTFTQKPEDADLLLVNTCAFIKPACQEAEENITSLVKYKRENKNLKIVVVGCYVERFKSEIAKKYPHVDLFIGPGEYSKFSQLLNKDSDLQNKVYSSPASNFIYNHQMKRILISPEHWVYVKISEGCNNYCSYCTIPNIRGKLRSRPIEDIAEEVKSFVRKGAKEINLISQDTTRYGEDIYGRPSLIELLKELEKIEGDFYIRVLYLYPGRITKELISFIKNSVRVVPYFEMPIQHVNDELLRKMNRNYTKEDIKRVWSMIRENIEDAVIRTTLMVGFPGETESIFEELLLFIEEYYFDRLGVFTYYPEENTLAKSFKNQVSDDIKMGRYDILMRKQKEISKKLNAKLVGRVLDIIIDGEIGKYSVGRSWREAPEVDGVIFVSKKASVGFRVGDKVRVRIKGYKAYDLLGEVI